MSTTFSGEARRRAVDDDKTFAFGSSKALKYPHKLNFYDQPPLYDVTIEDFETCALDRLRILAEIESSAARNRSWEETKTITRTQYLKYIPLNSHDHIEQDALRQNDHLGHFVLRLAFCRSDDLRRRFIKAETTLFKVKYQADTDVSERQRFLSSRDFNWISVGEDEKERYRDALIGYYQTMKGEDPEKAFNVDRYFKVNWTRVPDLVEKRKVFLKNGWAYVPGREQSSIVFQEFEASLERAMDATAKFFSKLDEDTRLVPILDNLSRGFLAGVSSEWSGVTEATGDAIRAEMVDEISRKHYPLCMRNMHGNLRKNRHLDHFQRLNYGLFLKVLGLSVEEALIFWRKALVGGVKKDGKTIRDEDFDKEYKYNVRHSYGLEGRRANYPAKSCAILLSPESSNHGCPYRHFDPENLETALLASYSSQGLSSNDLPEIMHTVKGMHYHVACTRVFEITHSTQGVKEGEGIGGGESVTHPNQFAARSIELEKANAPAPDAMNVDS